MGFKYIGLADFGIRFEVSSFLEYGWERGPQLIVSSAVERVKLHLYSSSLAVWYHHMPQAFHDVQLRSRLEQLEYTNLIYAMQPLLKAFFFLVQ